MKSRIAPILVCLLGGMTAPYALTAHAQNEAARKPTLYLIGDSTVNTPTQGQLGWGTPFPEFFDPAKINVENRALGGRSSRTFLTEGLWQAIMDKLQPNDFVLMQFGHNDSSAINDDSRARGSIRGTGEETQEIDNLLTKKHEVVHTYGWYLRQFIAGTKAKGATPIVLSPVPRNNWKDGKVARAVDDYGKWGADVARQTGVAFIDLNEIIARHYETLTPEKVKAEYFTAADDTHTSPAGAVRNAASVIEGIQALADDPFKRFLQTRPVAESIAAANRAMRGRGNGGPR